MVFDTRRTDSERGTLLHRILDEGFASFVADEYWGTDFTAAQALGYTSSEWRRLYDMPLAEIMAATRFRP